MEHAKIEILLSMALSVIDKEIKEYFNVEHLTPTLLERLVEGFLPIALEKEKINDKVNYKKLVEDNYEEVFKKCT